MGELDLCTLVERGEQLDSTLVSSALELRAQEDAQRGNSCGRISHALTEAGNVRVIVSTGHFGIPVIADNSRANAGNLVRRHADALAASADQYAEVGVSDGDHLPDLRAEDRIVDAFIAVGAAVVDVVALCLEPLRQRGLQHEARVITADGDSHGVPLSTVASLWPSIGQGSPPTPWAGRNTDSMGTVVVVGSLNVDLVVGLDRMPDPGETVMGRTLDQHPGGKGLNQAVAAARLGARVEMIGAVGSDDSGSWLRGIVTSEGIDDAGVRTVDGPSGTALIEVDRSGMNRIVVVPGANGKVTPDDVAAALSDIDDIAIVLTQGEVPLASIEAAMVVGKAKGARTILNPAPALDYPVDLLRAVDIVLPNEHEAAQLTGLDTSTLEGAQAAANHLVSLGVACAIITRGGDGAIWATAESSGNVPVFPVTPVDTVAAGDAFCGGLVAALAEGHELSEALRWAAAAGGLATTKAGAVPSLPSRAELDTLLR